jgi:hypothetical protein
LAVLAVPDLACVAVRGLALRVLVAVALVAVAALLVAVAALLVAVAALLAAVAALLVAAAVRLPAGFVADEDLGLAEDERFGAGMLEAPDWL